MLPKTKRSVFITNMKTVICLLVTRTFLQLFRTLLMIFIVDIVQSHVHAVIIL